MLRRSVRKGVILAMVGLSAPLPPAGGQEPDADVRRIKEFLADWEAAFNSGDIERMRGYWTEDIVVLPQGGEPIVGLDAFRRSIEQQVAVVFGRYDVDYRIEVDEVAVSGDMAFDRGTIHMSVTPKGGGAAQVASRRYLEILRKQSDGGWLISRAMNNEAGVRSALPPTNPRGGTSGTFRGTVAGDWQGTITVQGSAIAVRVSLEQQAGGLSGTVEVVQQGVTRAFDLVTYEDGNLRLEAHASDLVVEGSYDGTTDMIEGWWIQRGLRLPLRLRRTSGMGH